MGGDGIKLAVAILIVFIAMVAFFFAFHPGGVTAANNPQSALAWLMGEFEAASAAPGAVPLGNPPEDAVQSNTNLTPQEKVGPTGESG